MHAMAEQSKRPTLDVTICPHNDQIHTRLLLLMLYFPGPFARTGALNSYRP